MTAESQASRISRALGVNVSVETPYGQFLAQDEKARSALSVPAVQRVYRKRPESIQLLSDEALHAHPYRRAKARYSLVSPVRKLWDDVERGALGMTAATLTSVGAFFAEQRRPEREPLIDLREPLSEGLLSGGGVVRELAARRPRDIDMDIAFMRAEEMPLLKGAQHVLQAIREKPERIAHLTLESLAPTAAMLAAGGAVALARGTSFAVAGAAGAAGGAVGSVYEYEQALRDAGINFDEDSPEEISALLSDPDFSESLTAAQRRAVIYGLVLGASGIVSMKAAGMRLGPGPVNYAAQIPLQGALEGGGEAAAQFAARGEVSAGDIVAETVAGGALGLLDVGLMRSIAPEDARAGDDVDSLSAYVSEVSKSSLKTEAPEIFGEFVEEATGGATVFVSPEALESYPGDTDELLQQLEVSPEQMEDARKAGGRVPVKASRIAIRQDQGELFAHVREDAVMDYSATTVNEVEDVEQDIDESLRAVEQDRETTRQRVEQMVRESGRPEEEVAPFSNLFMRKVEFFRDAMLKTGDPRAREEATFSNVAELLVSEIRGPVKEGQKKGSEANAERETKEADVEREIDGKLSQKGRLASAAVWGSAVGLERATQVSDERGRRVAQEYMKAAGIDAPERQRYVRQDVDLARKIAAWFEGGTHSPEDPETRAAYEVFVEENNAQFQRLLDEGFLFEPGEYDKPHEALTDLRQGRMKWFPAEQGFGPEIPRGGDFRAGNIMLEESPFEIDGRKLANNDVFRIVHDAYGHLPEGFMFDPRGKEDAWIHHMRMYSPQAARAATTELRGKNAWMSFGPFADQNRKTTDQEAALSAQKMMLAPDWVMGISGAPFEPATAEQRGMPLISEAPIETFAQKIPLRTDGVPGRVSIDTVKDLPEGREYIDKASARILNFLRGEKRKVIPATTNTLVEYMKENLLRLYSEAPQEAGDWYFGAHETARGLAERYGTTLEQTAGVIAVLSPQKDADQNFSLAERVLDVWANEQNTRWTPEMTETAREFIRRHEEGIKREQEKRRKGIEEKAFQRLKGRLGEQGAREEARRLTEGYALVRAKDARPGFYLDQAEGRSLAEVSDSSALAAWWVRMFSETYHGREYRVTAAGQFGPWATSGQIGQLSLVDGVKSQIQWGGFDDIGKAINILRSPGHLNANLGNSHKVRNFYTNIADPTDMDAVTIDTHLIAASLLSPVGSRSDVVADSFGFGGSKKFGLKGTYILYAEAVIRAARDAGVLPHQLQAAVWMEARKWFSSESKRNPKFVESIDKIWRENDQSNAQKEIGRAIALQPKSDFGVHEGESDTSYERKLQRVVRRPGDIRKRLEPDSGGKQFELFQSSPGVSATTQQFFSEVAGKLRDEPERAGERVMELSGAQEAFFDAMARFQIGFPQHMAASIPGYQEAKSVIGEAIARIPGLRGTYIAGGEGAWAKAIVSRGMEHHGSPASVVVLDPNEKMERDFQETPVPLSVDFARYAFGEESYPWPEERQDFMIESMGFQRMSSDRRSQMATVKNHLKPDGFLVTLQKSGQPEGAAAKKWRENEERKNEYKRKFFDRASLGESGAVENLGTGMVTQDAIEDALMESFAHVVQWWDSGNFKGYIASDSADTIRDVLKSASNPETGTAASDYRTTWTPRALGGEEKTSSLAVDFDQERSATTSLREPTGDSDVVRGGFNPAERIIHLTEWSDPTTLYHELAHASLELIVDFHRLGLMDPVFVKSISDFVGADITAMTGEQRELSHERFAEAFEQFLYEGKSPSPELRAVFRQIMAWFRDAYRSAIEITQVGRKPINDEMRDVFARLLVVDDIPDTQSIFDKRPDWMTPKEYQDYLAIATEAHEAAKDKVRSRLLRDAKARERAEYRERLAEEEDRARKELAGDRAWVAFETLRTGHGPMVDGAPATLPPSQQEMFRQISAQPSPSRTTENLRQSRVYGEGEQDWDVFGVNAFVANDLAVTVQLALENGQDVHAKVMEKTGLPVLAGLVMKKLKAAKGGNPQERATNVGRALNGAIYRVSLDTRGVRQFMRESWVTSTRRPGGIPLVLYHGTHDKSALRAMSGRKRSVTWLSSSSAIAEGYGDGPSAVVADIRKPLVMDAGGSWWSSLSIERSERDPSMGVFTVGGERHHVDVGAMLSRHHTLVPRTGPVERVSTDDAAVIAKDLGADGLIVENVIDPTSDDMLHTPESTVVATFRPNAVREVRARFADPESDDYLAQSMNFRMKSVATERAIQAVRDAARRHNEGIEEFYPGLERLLASRIAVPAMVNHVVRVVRGIAGEVDQSNPLDIEDYTDSIDRSLNGSTYPADLDSAGVREFMKSSYVTESLEPGASPLVLYSGTENGFFREFDPDNERDAERAIAWASSSPNVASSYAGEFFSEGDDEVPFAHGGLPGGQVYPLLARLKNPLIIDASGRQWNRMNLIPPQSLVPMVSEVIQLLQDKTKTFFSDTDSGSIEETDGLERRVIDAVSGAVVEVVKGGLPDISVPFRVGGETREATWAEVADITLSIDQHGGGMRGALEEMPSTLRRIVMAILRKSAFSNGKFVWKLFADEGYLVAEISDDEISRGTEFEAKLLPITKTTTTAVARLAKHLGADGFVITDVIDMGGGGDFETEESTVVGIFDPSDVKDVRANFEALDSPYIFEQKRRLNAPVPKSIKSRAGEDPAVVAEEFGYRNGDELVSAINSLGERPNFERAVKDLARARTDKALDTELSATRLKEEVNEALANEGQVQVVAEELRILKAANLGLRRLAERALLREGARTEEEAGEDLARAKEPATAILESARGDVERFDRERAAKASARARQLARGTLARMRTQAQKRVQRMRVSEINQIGRALADIRRQARIAAVKVSEGKWEEAELAKRRELYGTILAMELSTAKEYRDKVKRALKRWKAMKPGKSAGDTASLKLIQDIIKGDADTAKQWLESEDGRASGISYYESIFNPSDDPTMQEMQELYDSLRSIAFVASKLGKEEKARRKQVNKDVTDGVQKNTKPRKDREELGRIKGGARDFLDHLLLSHRKAEHLFRELDDFEFNGVVWKNLFRPIDEAASRESRMRQEAMDKLRPVWDSLKSVSRRRRDVAGMSLSRDELLALALNWGNDGNREALLNESREWTKEKIEAALNALTDKEWDFVEDTWALIDSYWPQIADLEAKSAGVIPPKVEPAEFKLSRGRVIRGGYYPIMFDPKLSASSAKDQIEEQADQLFRGEVSWAATPHGHTKERQGSKGSRKRVWLSTDGIFRHLDRVIHDLTHREPVREVSRILNNRDVQHALSERYGVEVNRYLGRWLQNVAAGTVEPVSFGPILLRHLRVGISVAEMGASIRTMLVQPMGFTQAVAEIGPRFALEGLASLVYETRGLMVTTVDTVNQKSPYMTERGKTFDRDIAAVSRRLRAGFALDRVKDFAFWGISKLDMVSSYATWLGAYKQATANGLAERDAVARADQVVRITQGSGLAKDLADIQSGGEFKRLFTAFYTFFSAYHNMTVDAAKKAGKVKRESGLLAATLYGTGQFFTLVAVPAILTALVLDGGPDDDEEWWEWAGKILTGYGLSAMVWFRDVGSYIQSDFGYSPPPAFRAVETVLQTGTQISQGEVDKALVRSAMMSAGYTLHLPSRQAWRAVESVWEYDGIEAAANFAGLRHHKE